MITHVESHPLIGLGRLLSLGTVDVFGMGLCGLWQHLWPHSLDVSIHPPFHKGRQPNSISRYDQYPQKSKTAQVELSEYLIGRKGRCSEQAEVGGLGTHQLQAATRDCQGPRWAPTNSSPPPWLSGTPASAGVHAFSLPLTVDIQFWTSEVDVFFKID